MSPVMMLDRDPTIMPGTGPRTAADSIVPSVSRYRGIPSAEVMMPSTMLSAMQIPQNASA